MTFSHIKITPLLLALSFLFACNRLSIPPSATCTPDAEFTSNANHPKGAAAQAIIDKYIAKGIPGISILINDDEGFWISSAGFADIENGIEMQPCHINKLGSITKMMMGTLIWQLVQDGLLSIDDPISKHIPEVAGGIPYGDQITIAMLLNHSAGVYDIARDLNFNLAVINDMTKHWTSDEILKFLEGKEATHAPGDALRYSNSNTMLAALIVESVTGKTQAELLQERIFTPLGMDQTVMYNYSENFPFENLAQGYLDFNNDGGDIQNISNLNPASGNGYTGVYSTVTDLYRFMNALLRQKTLTSPENLDTILGSFRYTGEGGVGGFGFSIGAIHDENRDLYDNDDNIHAYGHGGGDIGYSANLNYYPHNNTIFAASYNYGTNLPSELGRELRNLRDELFMLMAE